VKEAEQLRAVGDFGACDALLEQALRIEQERVPKQAAVGRFYLTAVERLLDRAVSSRKPSRWPAPDTTGTALPFHLLRHGASLSQRQYGLGHELPRGESKVRGPAMSAVPLPGLGSPETGAALPRGDRGNQNVCTHRGWLALQERNADGESTGPLSHRHRGGGQHSTHPLSSS
jgi:hypothetical protein